MSKNRLDNAGARSPDVVARRAKKIAGPYDLIAVDGNSLAYRAYFALPTTITGRGATPMNAIYGFLSMLIRVLSEFRPKGLVVAFDSAWPTFRHEIFPEYKSGRLELKDELLNQMPGLRSLLSDLGIQCCSEDGIEADDFLASYAERGMRAHLRTLIISGDTDVLQLVRDPWVQVMFPRRGVSDYDLFSEADVVARTGVVPSRYVEYMALVGDASDNLAGVPGVGKKTAARIIESGPDLAQLLENLPSELEAKLKGHEKRVKRNLQLMRLDGSIVRDYPLDCSLLSGERAERELFQKFGLGHLCNRYLAALSTQSALL